MDEMLMGLDPRPKTKLEDPLLGRHLEVDNWMVEAEGQSIATISGFLQHLTRDYEHDYGTKIGAFRAAMFAVRYILEYELGDLTPNQERALMWELIQDWLGVKDQPMRIIQFEMMLWPGNRSEFDTVMTRSTWTWLQERARQYLNTMGGSVPEATRQHWQQILAGVVPFGYKVEQA